MIELFVFMVTGFAVSLAAWFLFDALPGEAIRFERRTLAAYGVFHTGIAYALTGPVLALDTAVSQSSGFPRLLAGMSISILWSVAIGMTIIGIVITL